ncbi:biogenesis of lysosome-related organelles complex 1 subunit 4 isoform X2 [Cephus cinctus]|uniref:Biogenesis of lysosome-related organelles complex 1 subunit 4 isoform X2 n=1 Tax=Cephus cinctus TaxID=211228 RepID=A0AAJ7RCS9_CEPCN|nr:biogenesis of lysosome-related organelles complex 1 subunit 4 isoform X2 [Cephus cinctus]
MIEELAKDYAAYAKVDLTDQMKNVHDSIEDMMTRLEEFESIIGMVQTEGAECMSGHIPRLLSIRPELRNLGKRIDALNFFVARANADLTALETAVDNAEAELGGPETIFGMLNPLSLFVSHS